MTNKDKTVRNLIFWGAVGFLFWGFLGTAIAIIVYALLDMSN